MGAKKSTRVVLILFGVIAVLSLGLTLVTAPVCRDWAFICENTGSRKGYREWCFGIRTGKWDQASVVESFMRQKFPNELRHRWTSYAGTGKNVFGGKVMAGHGRPGPILQLNREWLEQWFTPLSETEKKAFYDLLASGDRESINAKVGIIADEVILRRQGR